MPLSRFRLEGRVIRIRDGGTILRCNLPDPHGYAGTGLVADPRDANLSAIILMRLGRVKDSFPLSAAYFAP
jgi:hypothetical protein